MKILKSKTILLASFAMFAFNTEIANADNAPVDSTANGETNDVTVMTADLRSTSPSDQSLNDASGLFGTVETTWASAGGPKNFLVAFSPKDKPPGKEGCMNPPLSDEQMKKLVALRDQNRIETASKHAELIALSHKMTTLMGDASIDRKAVTDLFSKMTALKSDLAQQHLKLVLDTAEVFTPEQRGKMQTMILRRQAGPAGHMPLFAPPMPPHAMPIGGHMEGLDDFGPPPFGAPPMMGFFNPGIGPHQGPPPPPPGFGFGRPPGGGGGGGPQGGAHAGPPGFHGGPSEAPPPPPPGAKGFDKKGPSGPPPQGGGEPDN